MTDESKAVFHRHFPIILERGWISDVEVDFVRRDGSLQPVSISSTALCDHAGNFVMSRSTAFDVRERKKAEQALRASETQMRLANMELARALRVKDEFLANMSHELRTPLSAVLAICETLIEGVYGPLTERQQRSVRTGLGLALVARYAELHGGSVQVESEGIPGKGSYFTLILPIRANAPAATSAVIGQPLELAAPATGADPGYGGRVARLAGASAPSTILLADDNETSTTAVGEYLAAKGFAVVSARDGVEAIMRAEECGPALMIMDVQMPHLDGLEAIRRLRSNPRIVDTPIIALTALAMAGDRERCLQAGANAYFSKPVSLKALLDAVEQLLAEATDRHPAH